MHNFQENDNQMIEQFVGNQYGGYMATTNNFQGNNYGTFNPPASWVEYPFNKLFSGFYGNYLKVKELTNSSGYIYAWANIIRAAVMLRVCDTYGPIPYTKMGGGALAVEYDNVQQAYHAMISDLDGSIAALHAFLSENAGRTTPMAEFDLVYAGDYAKWIKFANTLKLRMAVRIARVDEDYAKDVMLSAVNDGCIEDNADNALLPTEDNPYRKASADWGDLAVSATLSAYMNGANADPRRSVYMTLTSDNTYRGVRMGIDGISKTIYSGNAYSKPNFGSRSPMLVLCAAETKFLKAEAALRGYLTGNAQALYEEGINTSMEQHGVSIGTYLTATGSIIGTYTNHDNTSAQTFNAGSNANGGAVYALWSRTLTGSNYPTIEAQQLEKIITQKWLALYPLGFEAWADFRRTGYPRLFPALNDRSSAASMGSVDNPVIALGTTNLIRMARRLPYPQAEYNGNRANVEAAVAMLGAPDQMGTNLWWALQ
jgi:hypothetical protein